MAKEKIMNVPNSITLFRLLLAIPLAYFIMQKNNFYMILLYSTIVVLDGVDGFIARMFKQKTKFGDHFDSFTDGFVVALMILLLYLTARIPLYILMLVYIGALLRLGAMIYFYSRKLCYKLFYVKSGMFVLYVIVLYILFFPDYNIWLVSILIAYTYLTILVTYIRLVLHVYRR